MERYADADMAARTLERMEQPLGYPSPSPSPAGVVSAPEPEPVVAPEPAPPPLPEPALSEVEAIICGVFGAYCYDALAVARCESGPDYYAEWNGAHIGTFQLYPGHAPKFTAHGWNYWVDGTGIYANSVVAYQIFVGRGYSWLGTSGWPVCGWRAGY